MTNAARFAAILSLAGLLGGCDALNRRAETEQAAAVNEEGIAKSCVASAVEPGAGQNATATINVGNDGGWCAVRTDEKNGQPYATGLVRIRPEHGRIVIAKSGNRTLVQYFPAAGYSGTDTFTAALRSRTPAAPDLLLKVAVTVTRAS